MKRRQFMQTTTLTFGAGLSAPLISRAEETETEVDAKAAAKPLVKLGLLTDVHYADKKTAGSRHYRESLGKVKEAAALFKEKQPAAIVCLGDIVDAAPTVEEEAAYLQTITAAMDESGIPRHHVLGNHCVSTLTKGEFFEHAKTESKTGHFSFDLGGVHFVVLDACYNKKMEPYGRDNFVWTDTNIPPEQQSWLAEDLDKTDKQAVVFTHQRLDLKPEVNYAVKQCVAVREILEKSNRVLAVFQGHSHKNELKELNGIPYCTLAAVVEGSGVENNSYSLLDVMGDGRLVLKGYRKQKDREFG